MGIQQWSDDTLVVRLDDDPELSEDMVDIEGRLHSGCCDIVLDLSDVSMLTSSAVSKLLMVRKLIHDGGRRLILCSARTAVWGLFINTGLDNLFEFSATVSESLARLRGGRA
jgi:anti-anti-sigma factor